jgi:hypothetical protein
MANAAAGVMFGPLGKWLADSMGKGPAQIQYNAPSYVTDPNYTQATNSLMPFASSLMSGQGLPPAYADLTQTNSPAFQQMLSRTTGNVLGATEDQMAGQGIGDSGVAMSAAAGAVGNATSTLTWQDFLNSQSNQLQMMSDGANIMGNIASMGLTNQTDENQFNLNNAQFTAGIQGQNIALQNQNQANWGQMMGSGASTLANLYGSSQLVPAAAAAAA